MAVHLVPMYTFIASILVYSVLCFLAFGLAYAGLGMRANFDVGDAPGSDYEHAFYHSWNVQATCMDEMTPKTRRARIAQAMQAFMAWLPMIMLLAPWNITALPKK